MPSPAQSFSTYLFDLDGTLIDSTALITSAFAHAFRTHRCPEPADDVLRSGFGTPLRTQLKNFARDAAEVDAMAVTYREFHRANHGEMVQSYPGIREQIAALHGRGVKLGIVTSKGREAAQLGLRQCDLLDFFDVLVTPADVLACKPDPAPVLAALEQLDAVAATTVFVGDSTHDIQAGRSAAVTTAAVLWGPYSREELAPQSPDFWLEHPGEIESVLASSTANSTAVG